MSGTWKQNVRFLATRKQLFVRAGVNYLKLALGRPVLRTLDLDLTYRCPCTCAHCYSENFRGDESRLLRPDEIQELVKQAIKLGALQISLSGGEPLVRTDLEEVIKACQPERTLVSMCTSGAGLKEKRLDKLIDAGLAVLAFSLDSIDPGEHDRIRGIPRLFENVLLRARQARHRGIPVIFNSVAQADKLASGELLALAELAKREHVTLNLTMPTPLGRWEGTDSELLSKNEIEKVEALLLRPEFRTDTHSTYWFFKDGPYCPAVREKIAINAYGEVRACQILPESYGNIRDTPLSVLWDKMLKDSRFDSLYTFCPAADRQTVFVKSMLNNTISAQNEAPKGDTGTTS